MKTRKLLLCFGVLFSLHSGSTDAQEKFMLLKLNGAESISVNLSNVPQYWLKGDSLFLRTQNEVQQFDLSLVQEIVFQDSGPASVTNLRQESVSIYPSLTSDYVYIIGAENESIAIFSAEGWKMPVRSVKQENGLKLDVGDFPMGVYQLKCGNRSFKFIKGKYVN